MNLATHYPHLNLNFSTTPQLQNHPRTKDNEIQNCDDINNLKSPIYFQKQPTEQDVDLSELSDSKNYYDHNKSNSTNVLGMRRISERDNDNDLDYEPLLHKNFISTLPALDQDPNSTSFLTEAMIKLNQPSQLSCAGFNYSHLEFKWILAYPSTSSIGPLLQQLNPMLSTSLLWVASLVWKIFYQPQQVIAALALTDWPDKELLQELVRVCYLTAPTLPYKLENITFNFNRADPDYSLQEILFILNQASPQLIQQHSAGIYQLAHAILSDNLTQEPAPPTLTINKTFKFFQRLLYDGATIAKIMQQQLPPLTQDIYQLIKQLRIWLHEPKCIFILREHHYYYSSVNELYQQLQLKTTPYSILNHLPDERENALELLTILSTGHSSLLFKCKLSTSGLLNDELTALYEALHNGPYATKPLTRIYQYNLYEADLVRFMVALNKAMLNPQQKIKLTKLLPESSSTINRKFNLFRLAWLKEAPIIANAIGTSAIFLQVEEVQQIMHKLEQHLQAQHTKHN